MMELKILEKALWDFLVNDLARLQKLEDYYVGRHKILEKPNRLKEKPDSKLIHNFPGYITTIATAYFIGKNINYKLLEDNLANEYEMVGKYLATEEEQQCNYEHAENCSIFGRSYELWYKNIDNTINFKTLDPRDVFVIRDNTIDKNIKYAIRWNKEKNENNEYDYILEIYDDKTVTVNTFTSVMDYEGIILTPQGQGETRLHGFNKVPIIEFINNKRKLGDFEKVITLIDGYNEAVSTSLDDMKDFTDAILVLTNMQGTDEEDIESLKKNKVMLLGENGEANWLIKNVNDTYSQNNKNRLNQDIHKFSFIPDMQDENFAGNSSGVALGYKLLALEQLTAQKEMYFKKALNERLELIFDYFGLSLKPLDVQKIFTRNTPENLVELSTVITNLQNVVSQESLISLLPFIEDTEAELKKIEKENQIEQPLEYKGLKNEQEKIDEKQE